MTYRSLVRMLVISLALTALVACGVSLPFQSKATATPVQLATAAPTATPTATQPLPSPTPPPSPPTSTATVAPTATPPPSATSGQAGAGGSTPGLALPTVGIGTPLPSSYTVQTGDTLESISSALGITVQALAAANGIVDLTTKLAPGQVLVIPPSGYAIPTNIIEAWTMTALPVTLPAIPTGTLAAPNLPTLPAATVSALLTALPSMQVQLPGVTMTAINAATIQAVLPTLIAIPGIGVSP